MKPKEAPSSTLNSELKERKIAVLGLGHADLRWEIGGSDSGPAKVGLIQQGQHPFVEPGLQQMLTKHLEKGTFTPTDDIDLAIPLSEILFLSVGIPPCGILHSLCHWPFLLPSAAVSGGCGCRPTP